MNSKESATTSPTKEELDSLISYCGQWEVSNKKWGGIPFDTDKGKEIARLARHILEAREVLKAVEWAGRRWTDMIVCPVCGGVYPGETMSLSKDEFKGHASDCKLATLLPEEGKG